MGSDNLVSVGEVGLVQTLFTSVYGDNNHGP